MTTFGDRSRVPPEARGKKRGPYFSLSHSLLPGAEKSAQSKDMSQFHQTELLKVQCHLFTKTSSNTPDN